MQLLGSLVAILAATSIASPTSNTPRQVDAVGVILSQVGKQVPPALARLQGLGGDKGKPTNGTKTAKKPDGPLGPLSDSNGDALALHIITHIDSSGA
ncbi:hypothetical protein FHL15_006642 [Xylaria flabelliformis]|uniref:Uncharacterized protein n=1 Tax=Xylaria flabelliformis TaxID=2512241 RepID=A0A553HX09_9PEZI|nr:hypothetical protein FHL15_006642 [Xylaria flabelliformis]